MIREVRCVGAVCALLASLTAFGQEPAWVGDARKVATTVPPKLVATLVEEIGKSGPEGAIVVCRETAPKLAKAASEESGWSVRRISLRNRNPKAVPDGWERAALEDFDRRALAGGDVATFEKAEVVTEDGKAWYRYVRALPVQPLCLTCHGSQDQIPSAVKERLKTLYPDDHATGYKPGEIRGAITLRKPA